MGSRSPKRARKSLKPIVLRTFWTKVPCSSWATEGPVLFVGDGATKCAPVLTHPNAHFAEAWPKAGSMLVPALRAWDEKRFEDIAYFEPSYLKDFIATVSRKKLF